MQKKVIGFTLIEIILVILALAILTAAGTKMITAGFDSYFTSKNIMAASWQSRIFIDFLTRDVQGAKLNSSITSTASDNLSVVDSSGTTISYTLSGNTVYRNGFPLAEGISNLTYTFYDSNLAATVTSNAIRFVGVSFNVTLNNTNYFFSTVINARNLVP